MIGIWPNKNRHLALGFKQVLNCRRRMVWPNRHYVGIKKVTTSNFYPLSPQTALAIGLNPFRESAPKQFHV